jgi:Predicted nucleoside-diphosphate-sugar epimerases
MILVAGAKGRLGSLVVSELAARGQSVRALVRSASEYRPPDGSGVEVTEGDVRDAAAVNRAAVGVDTVISAVHGMLGRSVHSLEDVDIAGNQNLVGAAVSHGVGRFVLLSMHGASDSNPLELARAKYHAEEALTASSLVGVIVRPAAFLETWLDVIAGPGPRPLILGRGRNPINFVSVRDVASVVVQSALGTFRGVLEIGGPDNLTLEQFAGGLIEAGIRSGTPRRIPRTALRFTGWAARRIRPVVARLARSAVDLDTHDHTAGTGNARTLIPSVPLTGFADVIATFPRVPTTGNR